MDKNNIIVSKISIHALREEGDRRHRPACRLQYDFYPRPPRGGRRTLDGVELTGM